MPPGDRNSGDTAGGSTFAHHMKDKLYERAKDLHVSGRSSMNNQELAKAIAHKQDDHVNGRHADR